MIKIEYCPNEKKNTHQKIEDFEYKPNQFDISKTCLSCGLFRRISKKAHETIYQQILELNPSKKYKGFNVDKGLDTKILDKLNSNKNIRIISVCTGHKYAVEPYATPHKYPEVIFCSKIKLNIPRIKDTTYKTEKNIIECKFSYRLRGKKNTAEWWKNVADIISIIH